MRTTTVGELKEVLESVGMRAGQDCLVHSSLVSLGSMELGADGVISAMRSVTGPQGTLIAPAFSYSGFRGETYNPQASPSRVGSLGARLGSIGERSCDPNFSFAALGPRASVFTSWWSGRPSIGSGSVFDEFVKRDVFIILLGVDFTALPVFMHLEAAASVSYRYPKEFRTTILRRGQLEEVLAVHWVRDESVEPMTDRRRIGELVLRDVTCVRKNLAYGLVTGVPIRTVRDIVLDALAQDPLILLNPDRPFDRN